MGDRDLAGNQAGAGGGRGEGQGKNRTVTLRGEE